MSALWVVAVRNEAESSPNEGVEILTFIKTNASKTALISLVEALLLPHPQAVYSINPWSPSLSSHVAVVQKSNVTDTRQRSLIDAAHRMGFDISAAAFAKRYSNARGQGAVERINPVTHRVLEAGTSPFDSASNEAAIALPPMSTMDERALAKLSEDLALSLSLEEMLAIQQHFLAEEREPNLLELETLAQTWSEHCVHKSFHAHVHFPNDSGRDFSSLLKHYLMASTARLNRNFVRSAFVDNAGVIAFDDEYDIAMKVETHNRPSALEPFGGAHTGIGGVVRDVLGVSASPFANSFAFCFDEEDRQTGDGIKRGVGDYGNRMGIPTVLGEVFHDEAFANNPLVFCGSFGLVKKDTHPRRVQSGDLVVVLGAKTGRDGLKGATFSSAGISESSSLRTESVVQVGHPMMQKEVERTLALARDEGLYHAITDCGAGGLSSAVCEMAAGFGASVDLAKVPLKSEGLLPWEIWLSESQERMVLAVPGESFGQLEEHATRFGIECDAIGQFDDSGIIELSDGDAKVGRLALQHLLEGCPLPTLAAESGRAEERLVNVDDVGAELMRRLSECSNLLSYFGEYDHEIQGGTLVKPMAGPSAKGRQPGVVMSPLRPNRFLSTRGVGLSSSLCVQSEGDVYRRARRCVLEAVCKAVAVGTDPNHLALLDNFCWGDVLDAKVFGALVSGVRACHDAAMLLKTPFVSGKDSLNNAYKGESIPGTLLVTACGVVPDFTRVPGGVFSREGGRVFCVRSRGDEDIFDVLMAVHEALAAFDLSALNAVGERGLLVLLAEMCVGGGLGLDVDATDLDLFGPGAGCFVLEVGEEDAVGLLDFFEARGVSVVSLGVVGGDGLRVSVEDRDFTWELGELRRAYENASDCF